MTEINDTSTKHSDLAGNFYDINAHVLALLALIERSEHGEDDLNLVAATTLLIKMGDESLELAGIAHQYPRRGAA